MIPPTCKRFYSAAAGKRATLFATAIDQAAIKKINISFVAFVRSSLIHADQTNFLQNWGISLRFFCIFSGNFSTST